MITDDEIGSGTSNDRSRTEDEEILDELDELDNSTTPTTTDSNTHEFNQLMPPYSLYPLL